MQVIRSLALVTGAAHRLGRELALGLAQRGFAIGLHYFRSEGKARQTAKEIEGQGVPAVLLPADLRKPEEVKALFQRLEEWDLRILVNSAGEMPRMDLLQASLEDWDSVMSLNLRAAWLCAQEAARRMKPGSLIVNITDAAVGKTWRSMNLYLLSKINLQNLTRLLARSLAPNIRVNAIAPGLILADEQTSPDEWQKLVDRLPLKRQGNPQSIVQALFFLWDNEYLTGETIAVDGGYQLT